jgi:hypothetical protein
MANVDLKLVLERRLELVPLRRGWWVTPTLARSTPDAHPGQRIIGELPKEGVMLGGGGAE